MPVQNNPQPKTPDREYIMFALRIMGDFGATIAVPVVICVLIGQHFDETYHAGPWFTIAGFALASLLSGATIYRKAKKYGEEYQKMK